MVYKRIMKTVESIIETLGREAIMQAVNVKTQAITNAKSAGFFHSSWYGPLATLAKFSGHDLPRDAFKWRESGVA